MLQTIIIFIISPILLVAWLFGFGAAVAYESEKAYERQEKELDR